MKIYSIETRDYDQNRVLVRRNKLSQSAPEAPKEAYLVAKDKKDEFVKCLENKDKKTVILSCLSLVGGAILGMLAGHKFPVTRVDAKAWSVGYGIVAGILSGLLGAGLTDRHYTNKLLKDFNAEKYSGKN